MKTNKSPISVSLPCCDSEVKVTHRKSKQQERPRNHTCPSCGKGYRINAAATPPTVQAS